MNEKWEFLEEYNAFLGDLMSQDGVRILMIVSKGVAVFSACPIEKHFVFKEDFLTLSQELEFVLAAKLTSGIPYYTENCESLFDLDTLENIHHRLVESANR